MTLVTTILCIWAFANNPPRDLS